jgi:hypothetical protein
MIAGNGRRFRVLAVVPFGEEDESPFVGLLQVEAAYRGSLVEEVAGLVSAEHGL